MYDTLLGKAALAIGTAAALSLSATVVDNKVTNVRQDVEIKEIIVIKEKLELFDDQVTLANKNLAVLNERLRNHE
jgi:hypothetical protein